MSLLNVDLQKGSKGSMNERQMELILQIVREQLSDYLADELVNDIMEGITEGINDNMMLIEDLGVEA